jgi:hypothetical protein
MELYDAIFYRKSIKKYSKNRISIDMFEEVKKLCEDIDLLNKDINVKAHPILKGDSLKFIIKKKSRIVAPHYVLITSEIPEDYYGEIGVPVTFFDKYNPEQFEIIGASKWLGKPMSSIAEKGTYVQGGIRFYLANGDGTYRRLYDRIVIRRKRG